MLTRDQILNAKDRTTEEVDVPEWGGKVCVSVMSGHARDKWESSLLDDKGNLLFTEKDIAALGKKSAAALTRVVAVARRLNRLGTQGLEEALGN